MNFLKTHISVKLFIYFIFLYFFYFIFFSIFFCFLTWLNNQNFRLQASRNIFSKALGAKSIYLVFFLYFNNGNMNIIRYSYLILLLLLLSV